MPRIPLPETNQLPQGMLQVRAADTTAVGRAMQGLGDSIAGLGSAFNAMAKKQEQEKEQQERVAVQKVLVDERLYQMQTLDQMQTDAPMGAPNFTKDYLGNFEKRRAELDKQYAELSPKARQSLDLGLSELRNGLADNAMRFESQSAGKKAVMDATETQQKLGQIAGMNPTEEGYNTAIAEWDKTVDALPNIDAPTREAIRANGREQISLAAAQAWVDANPDAAKEALTPQTGEGGAVTPQALLNVIAGVESPGYNVMYGGQRFSSYADHPRKAIPIASGPNRGKTSSAAGRYQFLGSTWDRAAKALGLTDFSPENQDKAAWWLAQQDYTARTGRDLAKDMASGQNIGEVRKALAPTWEGLQFISDAEFVRRIQKQGGAVKVTDGQTGVAQLDAIPQDKRNVLLNRAETKLNQDAAQNRAELAPLVENATAAYMATGEYSGPPITEQMFQRAYPEDGQRRYEQFQTVVETGEAIAEFKTLPVGEIQSRVEALQPATNDPIYADKYKAYEVAQAAAKQVMEARQRDPAAYVMQMFPRVNEAVEAASASDAGADAIRAQFAQMDAAYDQIGMPADRRFLLTGAQVAQAMDTFNNTELAPQERVAQIQQAMSSTSDPEQRQRIFEQFVAKDKDVGKYQAAFNAWERGDEGAARRLFSAALVNPDKVTKLPAGYTEDMVAAEVDEAMLGDNTVGDAKYGIRAGILENGEMFSRDRALAIAAVKQGMAQGKSIDEAVELTMRDIHGPTRLMDIYVAAPEFTINLYANTPENTDVDQFREGAVRAMPVFKQALEATLPPAPAAKDNEQGFVEYQRLKRRIEDIIDNGQLRNLGDGYGFYDPVTQGFVAGSDGQPIVLSLEYILNGERRR